MVDIMNNAGYEYDGGSRLRSSMANIDGGVTYQSQYTYDLMDRLETYLPPAPSGHGYLTYEYNALGQKTSITNGSVAVNYDYYANGWLKRVRRGESLVSKYTYDASGNRTRTDLGNTDYTTYDYDTDPRYRVSRIQVGEE